MIAKAKRVTNDKVAVRLLLDCHLGRGDEVVELTPEAAAGAVADGVADSHPDAVACARGIVAANKSGI